MTAAMWVTIIVTVAGAITTIVKTLEARGHANDAREAAGLAQTAAGAVPSRLQANASYGQAEPPEYQHPEPLAPLPAALSAWTSAPHERVLPPVPAKSQDGNDYVVQIPPELL